MSQKNKREQKLADEGHADYTFCLALMTNERQITENDSSLAYIIYADSGDMCWQLAWDTGISPLDIFSRAHFPDSFSSQTISPPYMV